RLQKALSGLERFEGVEAVTREAVLATERSPDRGSPEVASMLHGLAEAKNKQSRFAEGESLALRAIEMHRRLRGPEDIETGWALLSLAEAQQGQQKLAEAEAAARDALKIFRRQYSQGHKSVDYAINFLKAVLVAMGV